MFEALNVLLRIIDSRVPNAQVKTNTVWSRVSSRGYWPPIFPDQKIFNKRNIKSKINCFHILIGAIIECSHKFHVRSGLIAFIPHTCHTFNIFVHPWRLFDTVALRVTQNMPFIPSFVHINRWEIANIETSYRKEFASCCQDKLKKSRRGMQTHYTHRNSIKCAHRQLLCVSIPLLLFLCFFRIMKTIKLSQIEIEMRKIQRGLEKNKVRSVGELYPSLTPVLANTSAHCTYSYFAYMHAIIGIWLIVIDYKKFIIIDMQLREP